MATSVMVLSLLLATSMATTSQVHAVASPPPIFVFGDTYSDVGNNNALPNGYRADHHPYGIDYPGGVATGRFSNGYIIVDYFAQFMGFDQSPRAFHSQPLTSDDITKGINFASAGSGILTTCVEWGVKKCFTMDEQIGYFRQVKSFMESELGSDAATALISKSIFIVTLGAVDVNGFGGVAGIDLSDLFNLFVPNVTGAFKDQMKELYDLGARKIAIINAPSLGMFATSRVLDFLKPFGIDVQGTLNRYSLKFNDAQESAMKELSSTLSDLKYSIASAYKVVMEVINDRQNLGLKDVTSPCCGGVRYVPTPPFVQVSGCTPGAAYCSNRDEYLFWDVDYGTTAVLEYGSKLYYYNTTYTSPISIDDLVKYESSGGGIATI